MSQNLCIRITICTAALLLAACSSSDRQTSPAADSANGQAAVESTRSPQEAPPPAQTQAPAAPAMKVFMDPKTGEMRDPTPAELAAMERQKASKLQATQAPAQREERLRNRGVAMTIENNQAPLQACQQPDGSTVVDHNCADVKQPNQDKGSKP